MPDNFLQPLIDAWNKPGTGVQVTTQSYDQYKAGVKPTTNQNPGGISYTTGNPYSNAIANKQQSGSGNNTMAATTAGTNPWNSLTEALSSWGQPAQSTAPKPFQAKAPDGRGQAFSNALGEYQKLLQDPKNPAWQNAEYRDMLTGMAGKAKEVKNSQAFTQDNREQYGWISQIQAGNPQAIKKAMEMIRTGPSTTANDAWKKADAAYTAKLNKNQPAIKANTEMRANWEQSLKDGGLDEDAIRTEMQRFDARHPSPAGPGFAGGDFTGTAYDPEFIANADLYTKAEGEKRVYDDATQALKKWLAGPAQGGQAGGTGGDAGGAGGSAGGTSGGGSSDPYAGGAYGGNTGGSTGGGSPGSGYSTQQPLRAEGDNMYTTSVDVNSIWSPQALNERVNQANAQLQAAAGRSAQQMGQQLSGRGIGKGSGLSAALQAQLGANAAAKSAEQENALRFDAAAKNAQHILGSQQARANEGLGLAGLLNQNTLANQSQQQQMQQMIMSQLLNSLMQG